MAASMARGKVAITGSSGILGSRLYAALQANGWEVVGLGLADFVSQTQATLSAFGERALGALGASGGGLRAGGGGLLASDAREH